MVLIILRLGSFCLLDVPPEQLSPAPARVSWSLSKLALQALKLRNPDKSRLNPPAASQIIFSKQGLFSFTPEKERERNPL
jgi:hypothetical protein